MRWFRARILRWLGIDQFLTGMRTDLEAHGRAIAEVSQYQSQMEQKFQMTRYRIPHPDGTGETLLLATAAEVKQLRKESRERARQAAMDSKKVEQA